MSRRRPAAVLVIAILNLLGGVWNVIVGLLGCIGLVAVLSTTPAAPRPGAPPNIGDANAYVVAKSPTAFKVFNTVDVGLDLLLAILLISSGVGLLMMHNWARWVALAYAPLAVLGRLVSFLYRMFVVVPAMSELYEAAERAHAIQPSAATGAKVGAYGAAIFMLLLAIYPIVVALVLLLPSTARAFRAPAEPDRRRDEDDEGRDESWDEWKGGEARDRFRL